MKRTAAILLFICAILYLSSQNTYACTTCTIGQLGKNNAVLKSESKDRQWYFEYIFEQQNWDKMDGRDAHNLHHAGHHFHDKTSEDFHHLKFGHYLTDDLQVFADVPYVVRRSLEVDDHAIIGSEQKSEGLGDLHLIGDYRFWHQEVQSLGFVGGVKLPTGATKEENSIGTRFEPEMQPGSGSCDYLAGFVYAMKKQRFSLASNASYVLTTEGAQDFEFGDVTTLSLAADYLLNPAAEFFKTRLGIDAVYQNEQKQQSGGVSVADSGGETLLLGPLFKLEGNSNIGVLGTFLFPVYQHLGGVHQELDYTWTLAGELKF